jgi:hypothetical protein
MTTPTEIEIVTRTSTEYGCTVTTVVADPADAQLILYGTVTRDGVLIGSYYCADPFRQGDWRIVTATGEHLTLDGTLMNSPNEGYAVIVLTTILTAPEHEIDQRLRAATRPPQ